ncbi:MAG TPA: translation initiation factor IF-2 N-terminal domain-containing protein, partial [Chthoniobacterales bacterium]
MPTRTTTHSVTRKTAPARKPAKAAASSKSVSHKRTVSKVAKSKAAAKPAVSPKEEKGAAPPLKEPKEAIPDTPPSVPHTLKTVMPPSTVPRQEVVSAAPRPKPVPAQKAELKGLSLIDEEKPRPKRPESDGTIKRAILPPISRIRAGSPALQTPPLVSAPATPPPAPEVPPAIAADIAPAEAPQAEAEEQKIIHIKPPIIVKELASQLGIKPHQLIAELMSLNIFANINQTIEPDIASQICQKHGFVFEMERREKGAGVHKVEQVVVAPPPPVIEKEEELKSRGPIITFMGHVDHGKTSLLDAIRKTRVTASEAGGITQHIGAYSVDHKGTRITFIDTPGHAAFTAMRARGAQVTDIVVLVVAADDGLMPQTLEAISHAKAALHVKIMVAINKIDLPSANVDRVKKQLQEKGLAPEDWGGETIVCEVSATRGTGIDHLLEMMALQAEVMELKASPTATPRGTVIEAQVEPGRGPTATVIVQMGTLK